MINHLFTFMGYVVHAPAAKIHGLKVDNPKYGCVLCKIFAAPPSI